MSHRPTSADALSEWLTALEVSAPILGVGISRRLVAGVTVEIASAEDPLCNAARLVVIKGTSKQQGGLKIILNPILWKFHRAERLELVIATQAKAVQYFLHHANSEHHELCRRLGCDPTITVEIRNRWSRIAYQWTEAKGPHPLARFDDRKLCPLCHSRVSTGHKVDWKHDECDGYAKNILLPAMKLKLAEAKA